MTENSDTHEHVPYKRGKADPNRTLPKLTRYAEFSKMKLEELIKWKLNYPHPVGPKTMELAKFVIAVDEKREHRGSLRSYLTNTFGHVDNMVYCPLRVFRMMVAQSAPTGSGCITENDFDACPIKWHIAASQILGCLEKKPEPDGAFRETLAEILRTMPADGAKRLQKLRTAVGEWETTA